MMNQGRKKVDRALEVSPKSWTTLLNQYVHIPYDLHLIDFLASVGGPCIAFIGKNAVHDCPLFRKSYTYTRTHKHAHTHDDNTTHNQKGGSDESSHGDRCHATMQTTMSCNHTAYLSIFSNPGAPLIVPI